MRRLFLRLLAFAVAASAAATCAADAQTAEKRAPEQSAGAARTDNTSEVDVERLPVSVERIRQALEAAPESHLKLPERPTFSVKVEGRAPRIDDFIDIGELVRGPSQPTTLFHQEFLAMVTPPEALPYGSFSPGQLAVVAPQAFATGLAFSTVPSLIREAVRRRREEQARREVQEVLAELERRRRDEAHAGVSDPP